MKQVNTKIHAFVMFYYYETRSKIKLFETTTEKILVIHNEP